VFDWSAVPGCMDVCVCRILIAMCANFWCETHFSHRSFFEREKWAVGRSLSATRNQTARCRYKSHTAPLSPEQCLSTYYLKLPQWPGLWMDGFHNDKT